MNRPYVPSGGARKLRGTRSLGRLTARVASDWRRIAGPEDACRGCGGGGETRGLLCCTCRGQLAA